VPADLRRVVEGRIEIGRHSVIAANSVVLPGTVVKDGAMLGALSLARGTLEPWTVYAGIPARAVGLRDKGVTLDAEKALRRRETK
jgi:dTDP-4-amino-4,6-dideoxy-D-glucose acyltransferase